MTFAGMHAVPGVCGVEVLLQAGLGIGYASQTAKATAAVMLASINHTSSCLRLVTSFAVYAVHAFHSLGSLQHAIHEAFRNHTLDTQLRHAFCNSTQCCCVHALTCHQRAPGGAQCQLWAAQGSWVPGQASSWDMPWRWQHMLLTAAQSKQIGSLFWCGSVVR
jgi:hypothetical protein